MTDKNIKNILEIPEVEKLFKIIGEDKIFLVGGCVRNALSHQIIKDIENDKTNEASTDIDTKESDFSVIMVIAVDVNNNRYVLEYERHRSIPTLGTKNVDGSIMDKKGVVDYIIELYKKLVYRLC